MTTLQFFSREIPSPEKALEKKEFAERLEIVLRTIPIRERRVVQLRLGFEGKPKTWAELAEALNSEGLSFTPKPVSSGRARSIFVKAIRKLQQPSRAQVLLDYYLEK